LIHECTFENDKSDEAVEKNHSTINEAIVVAQRMNAMNLILTHFSQRYPRVFKLDADDLSALGDIKVVLAFDSMRIGLDDFERMSGQREMIAMSMESVSSE
jgi:ribonuclease Z